MNSDDSADAIRRRMAELRCELTSDVHNVSQSAQKMTDWTYYVRRFPWAVAGIAAAAGFMLMPRRKQIIKPDAEVIAELVRNKQLKVDASGYTKESQSLVKTLVMMGVTWAAKAGMNYIGEQIRSAAANKASEQPHADPEPSPLHEPWPK